MCAGPAYGATCPAGYAAPDGASTADDCYMEIAPGYYWTGTAVELCPAGHACAGGNMPYASHDSEWGIIECTRYPTIYTGMAYCGCPIDPLNGNVGHIYQPRGDCWNPASTDSGLDIGLNEYTTGTANCYWNGTNFALGGINTYGCDAYRITACAAGYYTPNTHSGAYGGCRPVEPGYYSPDGDTDRTACPAGLTTIGYGAGADEVADCGHALHVGDDMIYLRSTQKTTPSLKVKIGDDIFYGNASTENKGKLKIRKDGITYSIHDDSI